VDDSREPNGKNLLHGCATIRYTVPPLRHEVEFPFAIFTERKRAPPPPRGSDGQFRTSVAALAFR